MRIMKKIKFVRTYGEVPLRVHGCEVSTPEENRSWHGNCIVITPIAQMHGHHTRRFRHTGDHPYFFRLIGIPPQRGELLLEKKLARIHDLRSSGLWDFQVFCGFASHMDRRSS